MRLTFGGLWGLLAWALVSPALGGITVTSYSTLARVNGYAPVSQAQFFQEQRLDNSTPAIATAAGDWMGTNSTGSALTWHYVGSAQSTSTTTVDSNGLLVTASGLFAYELDTTAGFVDPAGVTIYAPSAVANYEGFFVTDMPLAYSLSGVLKQWGRVRLNTLSGTAVFDDLNPTQSPVPVSRAGTIPPGQYRVLITAGLGAPNFPNGVNQYVASGSYEGVTFRVQVPEPCTLKIVSAILLHVGRRRKRCAHVR